MPKPVITESSSPRSGRPITVNLRGKSVQLVALSSTTTTVGEVLRICAETGWMIESEAAGLRVGHRFLPANVELAPPWYFDGEVLDLVCWSDAANTDGSRPGPLSPGHTPAGPLVRVVVSGGPGAGLAVAWGCGHYVIGRDARCDLVLESVAVSAQHAELTVESTGRMTVRDLGATNGTYVGQHAVADVPVPVESGSVLSLGSCRLTLLAPARVSSGVGPPGDDGRRPFYRPPPLTARPAVKDLVIPVVPTVPTNAAHFNWINLLLPLVIGLAVAALFSPAMALFSLLGPVMSVANYVQERSKISSRTREAEAAIGAAAVALGEGVAQQRARDLARREYEVPDPGVAMARSEGPSSDLWERRIASCPDGLPVHIGRAEQVWRPTVRGGGVAESSGRPGEIAAMLSEQMLADVPVAVSLRFGAALGIASPMPTARAVARSIICQLASLVGPGELKITALTDLSTGDDVEEWSWVALLPHAQPPDSTVSTCALAGRAAEIEAVLDEHERFIAHRNATEIKAGGFEGVIRPAEARVVIVEVAMLTDAARSSLRRLVEAGSSGKVCVTVVALAASADLLPAFCSDVLTITDPLMGLGQLLEIGGDGSWSDVVLALVPVSAAVQTALRLAGLRDPESPAGVRSLPSTVSLVPLLSLGADRELWISALTSRWSYGKEHVATGFEAVLGMGEDGPFVVDFVSDGPHALVGGTTGSGKSELLRSLVVSIAATYSPLDANFVLIDYKGGSAFDSCAALPHVVGLVTDLDAQLGERALQSLEAELRWREHLLRDSGAADYVSYRREAKNAVPLARLMVIIDEFATMAKELPDFLTALIGIAQRGRSLGVHLLLATQRPSGVVNENIKANTNLRIALRVQDANDSHDILGSPIAAGINRRLPGRAFARLGPGELIRFQSARVISATSATRSADEVVVSVLDAPLSTPTDISGTIETLIEAVHDVWRAEGAVSPRRPWLDALPEKVGRVACFDPGLTTGSVSVGLLDEPARQRQRHYEWNPRKGNVALCGLPGGGASATLLAFAHQLAERFSPSDVHLYGLDFGEGILAVLTTLPHTGAVIAAGERERFVRLIRFLRQELDHRRSPSAHAVLPPRMVVFIDNLSGLLASMDEIAPGARDDLARLIADGPALGCYFVMSGDRPGAFPIAVSAALTTRIVFRLADPSDVVQFGIERRFAPPPIIGRGIALPEKLAVQMLEVSVGDFQRLAAELLRGSGAPFARPPQSIRNLPERVAASELVGRACVGADSWFLPLGLGDDHLEPVGFALRVGEHALITAPGHAGKSIALRTIGGLARTRGATVSVLGFRKTPVTASGDLAAVCTSPADLPAFVAKVRALSTGGPHLLLVDDAETVDDPDGLLAALASERIDNLRIVVAARADILRSKFGHWTVEVRRSRTGLILRPVVDLDGDLWFTTLPRRGPSRFRDGLGYLLSSAPAQLVQVAV